MAYFNFKRRFLAALPPMLAEIDGNEFVEFDPKTLSLLAKEDRSFIAEQGFPREASPFLSFAAYSAAAIQERIKTLGLSPNTFPFGHTGSGDALMKWYSIFQECQNRRS